MEGCPPSHASPLPHFVFSHLVEVRFFVVIIRGDLQGVTQCVPWLLLTKYLREDFTLTRAARLC